MKDHNYSFDKIQTKAHTETSRKQTDVLFKIIDSPAKNHSEQKKGRSFRNIKDRCLQAIGSSIKNTENISKGKRLSDFVTQVKSRDSKAIGGSRATFGYKNSSGANNYNQLSKISKNCNQQTSRTNNNKNSFDLDSNNQYNQNYNDEENIEMVYADLSQSLNDDINPQFKSSSEDKSMASLIGKSSLKNPKCSYYMDRLEKALLGELNKIQNKIYCDHFEQSMQSLSFIKKIERLDEDLLLEKKIY